MKTPANYSRGPHTAADYGVTEAYHWHNHNGTMMIEPKPSNADRFPPLKSQAEIDAEGIPGPVALGVMFVATFVVVAVMVVGVWMLGLQP